MNIETANRLLQYRKKHNLSQEELASKIGVSRQAISKWERAEASPDTDNLILLAEIYSVTLDELLKGKKETEESDKKPNNDTAGANNKNGSDDDSDTDDADNKVRYEKSDKVSFKNGIHIDSDNGDSVHINFKDGIHVQSKDGDKVDVGWSGIHVEEDGKKRVYTDENGNVMVDKKLNNKRKNVKNKWQKFPFFVIALIAFLWWGISGVFFGWALSWIVLLTIPLYYTLVDAVFERKPSHFAYPVLVVIAYIMFGYLNICGGWAFGWFVFLTIPVYYWICAVYGDNGENNN